MMNIRRFFFKIYWKIEGVIAPTLKYSQCLYGDTLLSYVNPNKIWLDLGCGHQILPISLPQAEKHLIDNSKMVVGIDYDLHSLRNHKNIDLKLRGNIAELPLKSNSFDLVTANMVVEHLDNPDSQFKEIRRILKPKGIFIFHTPNISGYPTILARLIPDILKNKLIYFLQGRKEEDVFDTFYKANSLNSIYMLADKTGFEVEKIKMLNSSAQFAIIPFFALMELIWIRILMMKKFKSLRPYIIAILKKKNNSVKIHR